MTSSDELKTRIEDALNSGAIIVPNEHHIADINSFENGSLHILTVTRVDDHNWQVIAVEYVPMINNYEPGISLRWSA